MKRFRCKIFLVLLALSLAPSLPAFGLSSVNVPIDDPVYRDIDKLAAFGLVKDVIYGQRPWSRDEIARIIENAIRQRETWNAPMAPDEREIEPDVAADELLDRLQRQFHEELEDRDAVKGGSKFLRFHPLRYFDAKYTLLESDVRPILNDNGLGRVEALINPLVAYDEGRHYPKGHQLSLETEHYLRVSPYFSFYARPRFEVDITNAGNGSVHVFAQQLYGKFTIKNTELEVGRDSLEWGQSEFGGILLSNNARPFDMIKVSNPSPVILPWVFKYLGPFRYTFFVANLGPEREFPYSFLTGLKLTIKPASFFELGIAHTMVLGGDGAPGPLQPLNVIREFFLNRPGGAPINAANSEFGVDFRFWLPFLRNTQTYLDMQFEDRSLTQPSFMFTELASYEAGVYVPRLNSSGTIDLRLEYRHGSPYFYRHSTFVTGMALNDRLWGDELGPQGNGVYAKMCFDYSQNLLLKTSLRYEQRNGSVLTEVDDASGRHVATVTSRPSERRIGWDFGGTYSFGNNLQLGGTFGYERIDSFNFLSGDNRNAFLGRVELRYYLF